MSQISNTARSAEHAATTVPDLRFRSTRPSPARLASPRLTVIRDTPKRAISACSDGTLRPGGHDPARIGRAIARRICRCSGPSPSSARSGSGVTSLLAPLSRTPPKPSDRLELPHRLTVADKQAVAIAVAAALDHMRAAADDVGDGGVVGGEDPRIEDDVAAGRGERGRLAVEHRDVGALPRRDRADRATERLRTAGAGGLVQPASGRTLFLAERVAAALREPLRVFEPPQLLGGGDADERIRADAEASALGEEAAGIEHAIAEIGLGDRAQAGDGARR